MTTQINITKVYSVKSSATRAYKNAGSPDGYAITETLEGWSILPAAREEKVAGKKPRTGNCRKVWDIADNMVGARRKDVIEACVNAGINSGTAKTQYQQWFASRK